MLSIPVRLAPAIDGMRKARVGWVLAGPGSLPELATIQTIFTSVQIAVTTPDLDIDTTDRLPLDQLVPALPAYSLVVDHDGDACPGLDLACAILGVPYHGASPWWPPVRGTAEPDDISAIRRLLSDHAYSAWRRDVAMAAARDAVSDDIVQWHQELALASSRPEPVSA
jgi:hypothetical protein